MIAVVARLVDRNTNDVLCGLCIDVLAKHALMMHHLAFASRYHQFHLVMLFSRLGCFCGLFGRSFGRSFSGSFFRGSFSRRSFTAHQLFVFAAGGKISIKVAFLIFFELFFDIWQTFGATSQQFCATLGFCFTSILHGFLFYNLQIFLSHT